ncbi:hypothetical protein Tco_0431902 [Tanacetum coccineum]
MEEVEVAVTEKTLMLLKYLEHQMYLLEEVEEVAMMVETQEEILVRHVSFVTFYELPPDQQDVDWNNLTPRTSTGLHTSGGGGRDVVVVIVVIVDVDVGSGA